MAGEGEAADAIERVADLVGQVNRLQRRGWPQEWLALELTMAQMKVLFVLHHQGPSKVSDLAEMLGVTAPSMTGTLERVVRGGLVQRRDDPTDRRLVLASLTPEGQALVERLQQGRRARLMAALARLDEGALADLERALGALRLALEEDLSQARAPEEHARAGETARRTRA